MRRFGRVPRGVCASRDGLEAMLKDLHTVQHEPRWLARWVELAKTARAQVYG